MTGPTMKAAIYRRPGEVEVTEVDLIIPAFETHSRALVAVEFCGICGTDLHMVLDGWGRPDSIFGHEWSGRIIEPGNSELDAGTLVVGLPQPECGSCDRCRAGRTSLCRARNKPGTGPERGAFATHVHLDPTRLVEVPDGVDARAAAYTEPLAVALHAVTLSEIEAGQRALVFGAGPIGAAVMAILTTRGIDVEAVEPSPRRAELADRLGATVRNFEDLTTPSHPAATAADAVDVVFESSGARAAAEAGLGQLTSSGLLMLVGTGMDFPQLDTNRIILNELRVSGAYNYDAGGFFDALGLIAEGSLPLDELIEPDSVGLDGMFDAMQRLRAGEISGKMMVKP